MSPRPLKWLLLKGFLFLVIGLILWVLIQPSYSRLIVSVSQKSLSWIESREKTSLRLQGDNIVYIPVGRASKEQKTVPAGRRDVRDLHYNSVIFFALILLSPSLPLAKRMRALVLGLLILFLTQVLTVLVQVQFFYALQLGDYSRIHYTPWEKNLYAFLKQFFELVGRFAFPFAIWMLFTYRETVNFLTQAPSEKKQEKERNTQEASLGKKKKGTSR